MTKCRADLVIDARWVVPVEPAGAVLEDHGVVVRDGRIAAVLPAGEVARAFAPAERVNLPEHVLIPGLVNLHTHAAMSLMRGLADDLPLMTLAAGAHLAGGDASTSRPSSCTTARCSPAPRCCAAASPASTTCISFPRRPRGRRSTPACARASG